MSKGLSGVSLKRGLIPHMRVDLINFQRPNFHLPLHWGNKFQHMNLYGVGSFYSTCKVVILGLKHQGLRSGYVKKTLASEQATECKRKKKMEDNHIYNEISSSSQGKIIENEKTQENQTNGNKKPNASNEKSRCTYEPK